jgi:hypothetical protein
MFARYVRLSRIKQLLDHDELDSTLRRRTLPVVA